jgi:nitrate/nitrite transport system ATP-binding protein
VSYLQLNSVSKNFPRPNGEALEILRDVDLKVEKSEFVCIVGRSGSGKSTLISLIAGLLEPDRGEIFLEGKAVRGAGPERGIVFQNYSLLPWMSVFENVYLAVDAVAAGISESEKRARTQHYVDLVNLKNSAGKRPRELSGGMRQRVAVARGLAMEPKVLLLDEPFSALDALTRATLQEELARIWTETKKTVVMITNDIDEAILLADAIYPLTSGPGATIGRAIPVDLPHPRDRRQLGREPAVRGLRGDMLALLSQKQNGNGGAPAKKFSATV